MCEHTARANRLLAAYQDALLNEPAKRAEALTAIYALRQVVGVQRSELQSCALPHAEQAEVACLS